MLTSTWSLEKHRQDYMFLQVASPIRAVADLSRVFALATSPRRKVPIEYQTLLVHKDYLNGQTAIDF